MMAQIKRRERADGLGDQLAGALRHGLSPGSGLSERRDGSLKPAQQLPLDRGLRGQFASVNGVDQRLERLGRF